MGAESDKTGQQLDELFGGLLENLSIEHALKETDFKHVFN